MGFKSDAERDQAVDSILVSGKTLLHLINDVLDFSKLEDGRMEIVPEPTDCGRLVGELVETFRIASKVPAVEFRCRADGLPILMVDPQRVRQMLFNLVGNAAKFTESGFVEVRAAFARDNGADIGTFRLEVEDTGCGISEDDLKIVASPYVQVGAKLARHGGTGLGLAICRQLAAAMGGELSFVSTLGKGSTFAIAVPNVKVSDAVPAAEPSVTPVAAQEKKRILIVDDQKMNLTVLKAMLKKLGYLDVTPAADGKLALTALESGGATEFGLVLTDMWMPELDGEGLVRAIRANAALAKLPVYVITADVEMLAKSEAVGFDGILLKPVTVDKLREIL